MVTDDYRLEEILEHLDPGQCSYQEWVDVGMAIQQAGEDWQLWDDWSRRDPGRYHSGECQKKWRSFGDKSRKVTVGTIVHMAMAQGWTPAPKRESRALTWDSEIGGGSAERIIDQHWIMPEEVPGPQQPWNPAKELTRYLSLLFNADEFVGYSVETWETEDGWKPTKGSYTRTAGEIQNRLQKYKDDLGSAIGDYKPEVGGWIRFNPLDGNGVSDKNVTAFRYALIESDSMPLDKQYATIQALKLPVQVLVHSGKKSLHAIVHVDADSYDEYRKRVDELYKICEANGMQLDRNNRNPSRLSRMPGLMRGGQPQYIVAEHMGCSSWDEWKDYIEGVNDDLPDMENLSEFIKNPPELAPELIGGVLRQGHKMLISGASKAGKSFLLMELCVSIAEGLPWLGHECRQGRVMYLNLELDRASCLRRFADVYAAMGLQPKHADNIDIWNLRGRACPMDKLTPKLIRRMKDRTLDCIVIDPIYKVITGDENTAADMALFCNQFDRIATELGCSVIYCHHHSKGSQGQKKSMDRASGSGVFARDPDALLDLIELPMNGGQRDLWKAKRERRLIEAALDQHCAGWRESVSSDQVTNIIGLRALANERLPKAAAAVLGVRLAEVDRTAETVSGWRMEYTLREFRPTPPTQCFFQFPLHVLDVDGELKGARADGEKMSAKQAREEKKAREKERDELAVQDIENAIANANMGEPVTVKEIAEYLQMNPITLRGKLRKLGYKIDKRTHMVASLNDDSSESNMID